MNHVNVSAHLRYQVEQRSSFAFSIVAARTPFQSVTDEHIDVGDGVAWSLVPYGGGSHQILRLTVEPGDLVVSYRASAAVGTRDELPRQLDRGSLDEVPFEEVPADILPYLNPSRYCESDRLGDFAFRLFGHVPAGYDRVQVISDWVNQNLIYTFGSTDASSSTTDVLLQRAGVCRDFAHAAISLCRAMGVPARYVSGYGVGVEPQDFHGFFEAYVGTAWYLFDPTGMARTDQLVRIGDGRDAADAPFATLVGRAFLTEKDVRVELQEISG